MDMEKYKPLFIEESREHLSALSSLFLKLESNTDSLANSLANVADIFRHVHSIKGMAASMHYGPVADLAHTMEDAIDLYRNSGSAIPSEHIDIFLRAVDGLSAQVEAVALDADLPGFSDLSAEIKVLAQSAESILKKSEVEAKKNEPDKGQKEKTRTGTQSLLANRVIRLKILKTSRLPSVRAFMAYRKISDLTEILKTQPDVSEVKKGHLPENEFLLFIGPTPEDADLLDALKNVDEIDSIDITTIAPEAPKDSVSSPVRKVEATKAASSATIRVRTDILDTLIDNVGELLIARDQLGSLLPDVGLQPDVQVALDTLGSQVREIYSKIMTVRLTPLNTLTERYPRIVRDLARELGKEVELVINGADIELDRSILESLDEPLLHSIRNAIDHGIETPKKRIEAGKDARGKVIIEATRDRDSVIINVEDDGGGINTEQIKKIALERGVVSAQQAESLSQREAHFLICLPGFSTKDEVTGVSGRGVGMDVVR
ncbi:Hpt domain-containing protein, partial [Myxococcota bacterium]|nr:Hpt domain-containing protein [Myxococcota bacterium]